MTKVRRQSRPEMSNLVGDMGWEEKKQHQIIRPVAVELKGDATLAERRRVGEARLAGEVVGEVCGRQTDST